jgi:signal transduction histidine kinase
MSSIHKKIIDVISNLVELIKFPAVVLDKKSNITLFNSIFKNVFLDNENNEKKGTILLDIIQSQENKEKIQFFLNNPSKSPFLANVSKDLLEPFIDNLLNLLNALEIKTTNLISINVVYKNNIFELILIRLTLCNKELFLAIFISPKAIDTENTNNIVLLNKEIDFLNKKIEILASIINKVLTTTKAFTETLLLDGYYKDPEVSKNLISIIDKEAKEGIKLILNIVKLKETLNLNKQRINSYDYFLSIAQNFNPKVIDFNTVNSKNVLFKYFIQPNLPSVSIDTDKFTLAINNILDNALKFQDLDKEENYIDFKVVYESNENYINITISDNGLGIEDTSNIGEPFKTFSSKSGLGLGLYVAKNILKKHDCNLEINSTLNKGTTFTLKLPV